MAGEEVKRMNDFIGFLCCLFFVGGVIFVMFGNGGHGGRFAC